MAIHLKFVPNFKKECRMDNNLSFYCINEHVYLILKSQCFKTIEL